MHSRSLVVGMAAAAALVGSWPPVQGLMMPTPSRNQLLASRSLPSGSSSPRHAAGKTEDDGGIGQALDAAAAALEAAPPQIDQPMNPELLARRSRALWRIGWTCWWVQLILSVISAVVLAFARLVAPLPRGKLSMENTFLTGGVLFSSLGLATAFFSVIWSWHYTRLSRRDIPLVNVRSALRFGVILNLSGMALTLVSAEQVVGGLIAKLLLTPGSLAQLSAPAGTLRPAVGPGVTALDIFVVQANTNTMCSHLAGLITSLVLLSRSRKW